MIIRRRYRLCSIAVHPQVLITKTSSRATFELSTHYMFDFLSFTTRQALVLSQIKQTPCFCFLNIHRPQTGYLDLSLRKHFRYGCPSVWGVKTCLVGARVSWASSLIRCWFVSPKHMNADHHIIIYRTYTHTQRIARPHTHHSIIFSLFKDRIRSVRL